MATNFDIPELISKKKRGQELSQEEIEAFVDAVVNKRADGAQIGAMLMAMCLQDLTSAESSYLTRTMRDSGETLTWPKGKEWDGLLVDKHSTGGVGDKISLILAPALAACGLKVPMISGRGLGHTGGTLDKLEAIPGFSVAQKPEDMVPILRDVGCCIVGQTANLCPADKILYQSRDITSTVDNIGLITASIVSKKAAESIDALVLDVKTGKGAFCKDMDEAKLLATRMVEAGKNLGIKTSALITDMNSPIGFMIGNALEVIESIECLRGNSPQDVRELVENLGAQLLLTVGMVPTVEDGREKIRQTLENGQALEKFRQMAIRQGVEKSVANKLCDGDVYAVLPKSQLQTPLYSSHSGTVVSIDPMICAKMANSLGAGRKKADDVIAMDVGLQLLVSTNSLIKEGDPWVIVHHNEQLSDFQVFQLNSALNVQAANSRILKTIH